MTLKCETCQYYSHRTKTCNYLLTTGHPRGCPAEDCEKHKSPEIIRRVLALPPDRPYWLYKEVGATAGIVKKIGKEKRK